MEKAPAPIMRGSRSPPSSSVSWKKRACSRWTIVTAPSSADAAALAAFQPDFNKYRAVVFNYDAPDWPAALKDSFERYVNGGGGLVIVHAADNAFASAGNSTTK